MHQKIVSPASAYTEQPDLRYVHRDHMEESAYDSSAILREAEFSKYKQLYVRKAGNICTTMVAIVQLNEICLFVSKRNA